MHRRRDPRRVDGMKEGGVQKKASWFDCGDSWVVAAPSAAAAADDDDSDDCKNLSH